MESSEPQWIRSDVVRAIHSQQLAEHGGQDGVFSESALDASLANPKHFFVYTTPQPDIPAIAAQYAFSIVNNHPFFDGNKRTAAVVCEMFLILNGYDLTASDEESYGAYIRLAQGKLTADEMAAWIRSNSR